MEHDACVDLLRKTAFFREVSDATLFAVAGACKLLEVPTGQVIFEKDAAGDGMYVTASGTLEVYIGDAVLDRIEAGDCFGEMALVTSEKRTASVRAATDARLLHLPRDAFREMAAKDPDVAWGAFREMSDKVKSSIDVRLRQHESMRHILGAFERAVSRSIMDEMLASKSPVELMEGTEARATIAFADIRGFTTMAEGMSPHETIRYLNGYLGACVDLVLEAGGTIDKFMGDGIMVYFGAPLSTPSDALHAVECAQRMSRLFSSNALASPAGRPAPRVGIGLATGLVIAGGVGNARRMDYTVMGDVVNLASRIEGLTKQYKSDLLFCEETANRVKATLPARFVDAVRVKGKTVATRLYDLVDDEALRTGYAAAMASYREGRFAQAASAFAALRVKHPNDGPTATLAERCVELEKSPPPDWDGTSTATMK